MHNLFLENNANRVDYAPQEFQIVEKVGQGMVDPPRSRISEQIVPIVSRDHRPSGCAAFAFGCVSLIFKTNELSLRKLKPIIDSSIGCANFLVRLTRTEV